MTNYRVTIASYHIGSEQLLETHNGSIREDMSASGWLWDKAHVRIRCIGMHLDLPTVGLCVSGTIDRIEWNYLWQSREGLSRSTDTRPGSRLPYLS